MQICNVCMRALYYSIIVVCLYIHLIHLVPLGVQTLFDGLASEELVADQQHAIWVRLAFDQSAKICVLYFQILSFNKINPQHSLMRDPSIKEDNRRDAWIILSISEHGLLNNEWRDSVVLCMGVHLRHREAKLCQLNLTYQRHCDPVRQHHVSADNILNHLIWKATANEKEIMVMHHQRCSPLYVLLTKCNFADC